MLVITCARAFDNLPWYHAATALEAVASIPDGTKLLGEIR